MTKRCRGCLQEKELSEFGFHTRASGKLRARCKTCNNQKTRDWRDRNPEHGPKYSREYRTTVEGRYNITKSSVKSRGWEFTISLADYETLVAQPCLYCGGPLPLTQGGLDRLDNTKGYTLDNLVPCCTDCNLLRQNRVSPVELKLLVDQLSLLRGVPIDNIWQVEQSHVGEVPVAAKKSK